MNIKYYPVSLDSVIMFYFKEVIRKDAEYINHYIDPMKASIIFEFLAHDDESQVNRCDDILATGDTVVSKPTRYRVKSVEQMEKLLEEGLYVTVDAPDGSWFWDEDMWEECGREVKPYHVSPYKWVSERGSWFLAEWVEPYEGDSNE